MRILATGEGLDNVLSHLVDFDAEVDPEGKEFSGRLLNVIFEKENQDEINLLTQFSVYTEPVEKSAVKIFSGYTYQVFESLMRKDMIWLCEGNKLTTHPLIREFAYDRLKDKEIVHKEAALYYEKLAKDRELKDIHSFEMAFYHFTKAGGNELKDFKRRMDSLFKGKNVKELIDSNMKLTIERLLYAIKIYPEFLPYYNELGITYRENNQLEKAIEVLEKGLEVDPKDIHLPISLVQIYLFFQPDKKKAQEWFDFVKHRAKRKFRERYKKLLLNLEEILNFSAEDFVLYDQYSYNAIQNKAYLSIIPFLEELNKKYPNKPKVLMRLGKTFCNPIIGEDERGIEYI